MGAFQRARLLVGAIMFLMLFGFVRNIILDNPMDGKGVATTTIIFIVWMGLTDMLTDFIVGTPRFSFGVNESGFKPPSTNECP